MNKLIAVILLSSISTVAIASSPKIGARIQAFCLEGYMVVVATSTGTRDNSIGNSIQVPVAVSTSAFQMRENVEGTSTSRWMKCKKDDE